MANAINYLGFYTQCVVAIDDEIVDFTQKGGWHKIDKVLFSRFSIIFHGQDDPLDWAMLLSYLADELKVRKFLLLPGQN